MTHRTIRPGKIERLVRSLALRYQHLGVWSQVSREALSEMLEGDAKLQLDLALYKVQPHHLEGIKSAVIAVLKEFEGTQVLPGVASACSEPSSETS